MSSGLFWGRSSDSSDIIPFQAEFVKHYFHLFSKDLHSSIFVPKPHPRFSFRLMAHRGLPPPTFLMLSPLSFSISVCSILILLYYNCTGEDRPLFFLATIHSVRLYVFLLLYLFTLIPLSLLHSLLQITCFYT